MRVIRADEMGMCFGVRDALQIATEVADPTVVTIHGELVHNAIVNDQLTLAGVFERNAGADIRVIDTVCHPTKRWQSAMVDLLRRVDAVVVVGGSNSNNTLRLVELCRQHGKPALHVQDAGGIDENWLSTFETIGLTAGTSTLDQTIDEVQHAIQRVSSCQNKREIGR
ncbi:MAG: hypothetical protein KDB00_08250 [Planctomycetales bacterium]|nr:hypothetical protein [Planctomycetales bacterium]